MQFHNYPHGESGGKNLGLAYKERKDLESSIKFLKNQFNVEKIVIFGISYGGTIAISNSSLDSSIKGIVVDSPFYDLPELLSSEVSNRTFIPEFIAKLLKFGIINVGGKSRSAYDFILPNGSSQTELPIAISDLL